MTDAERVVRYVNSIRAVLSDLSADRRSQLSAETLAVLDTAERYSEDAEHYSSSGDLSTALACVSYAEGLLDALRFLRIVDFGWPSPRSAVID